jgi:hypothetical protein
MSLELRGCEQPVVKGDEVNSLLNGPDYRYFAKVSLNNDSFGSRRDHFA